MMAIKNSAFLLSQVQHEDRRGRSGRYFETSSGACRWRWTFNREGHGLGMVGGWTIMSEQVAIRACR